MTSAPPHVAVHATAHRDVTPDRFEAVVGVVCRRTDAGAAAQALTAGFAQVEDTIAALSPELDVTARRGGVSQRRIAWPDQAPEWIASRHITLTSHDVEQAGAVLGPFAALIDAVDGLELNGPNWQLDRENPAYGELQVEAVHEARGRAERYAGALGGRLGPLIEIADPGAGTPGWSAERQMKLAYAGSSGDGFETMDFTPVPIEVEVSVEASWTHILP
jgi:uncharacterized protein YggE